MSNKKLKNLPKFRNEDQERKFWDTHESFDYFDEKKSVKFDLSVLKPSTKKMTIRMSQGMLNNLKILANKKDVPYQSLVKMYLEEKINEEFSYETS